MKKLLFIVSLVSTILLHAQNENFDIATFTRPSGWQRLDSNGAVLLYHSKTVNGTTKFCQIILFPSRDVTTDAQKNFRDEWQGRVTPFVGTTNIPQTQTQKTPDGWTAVSGSTNVSQNGIGYACMLSTITGHGKEMSVIVNIAGQEYADDVVTFFDHLDLRAPTVTGNVWNNKKNAPEKNISNQNNSFAQYDYVYQIPSGWTPQQYADGGVVITSPVYGTGEKCTLSVLPMRSLTGDLQSAANGIFAEMFGKNYTAVTTYTSPSMIRGTSPQGWDYFITKQGIKPISGNFSDVFAFVFVAKLNNQVAVIAGISKDPLVSNCFGLNLADVWPKFFYSLQFKNWNAEGKQNAMMKQLAGVWIAATATAGDRMAFTANGRFAGASAANHYYASSNQLLTVTDAYFGDGAYSIKGNQLIFIHDNNKNNPEPALFRIQQESIDGGQTWKEKLYLLRKSSVDGSEYELGYEKQKN